MNPLHELIKKNELFHLILLMEVNKTPYGQITVNVELQDGIALIDTLNIVKSRRKKYAPVDKGLDKQKESV